MRDPNSKELNAHRKNRKWTEILAETYKDFALNTSIHRLKYTVKNESGTYEKLFWYIIVLVGFFVSGYMTVLFWNRYSMNPTRTTILTNFVPTTAVVFPAVTLCNVQKMLQAKINKFLDHLNVSNEDKDVLRETIPQLAAFTSSEIFDYNVTDLSNLQRIFNKSGHTDIANVLKSFSQSCEELLLKCFWNNKQINCLDFFEESLSNGGFCCSFNYLSNSSKKILKTAYSGRHSGLSVVLNPIVENSIIDTKIKTAGGIRVLIHHPCDYPGSESMGKIVSSNRYMNLQIRGTLLKPNYDIEELPLSQRKCFYDNEQQLELFSSKTYTSINCKSENSARSFLLQCGCIPFHYGIKNKPVCDATKIPCIDRHKNEGLKMLLSNRRNCIPLCKETIYDVLSIGTSLHLNQSNIETSTFLSSNEKKENNTIILNIYFMTDTQTILLRARITSTIHLLCSFGGVYSLFLGCSLLTIVEIIYYFFFRFFVNLKLFSTIWNDFDSQRQRRSKRKRAQNEYKNEPMRYNNDFYAYNTVFIN